MTHDTKRDLLTWLQYFLIALMAELSAWLILLPNDANVEGYFQLKVGPHLYAWLTSFSALSLVTLAGRALSRRDKKSKTDR